MKRFWAICFVAILACAGVFFIAGHMVFAQNNQDASQGEADVSTTTPVNTTGILPPGVTAETFLAGNDVPRMYPRAAWEEYVWTGSSWQQGDSLRSLLTWLPRPDNSPPDYQPIDRIIVHDQGCLNPSTCTANAENFPIQTVQNIFRSHAVTRGWGDIGYNYIIDRRGRIFEGRYGGNGVRGAHTYADARCENLNVGSAGVLLLGDLRAGPMTQAQSESLSRLAGWLGATNGIDMGVSIATTTTWRNPPRSGGGCDLSQGSFSGTLSAPRLASHGDVEAGNSDTFDLSRERLAVATKQAPYASLAYRTENSTESYTIRDGALQALVASNAANIVGLAQTQLELFPRASVSSLPNGSLVKSRTRPRVYAIEDGRRRAIPTADLFVLKGYRWDAIQELSDRELALTRLGTSLPYPDSYLVKGSGEEVYVFENAQLRHVTSASLFEALKYAWTSIRNLFDDDLAQYPKGEPKLFPDGTLVKGQAPRVWKLEQGKRRAVLSASLFSALGFKWTELNTLSATELSRYPEGQAYLWPEGTLIRAQGEERVYLMHGGYKRWIQTAEAFQALGYRWSDVRIITSEEITAAPEAQPIANINDRNLIPQPLSSQPATSSQQPAATPSTQPVTGNPSPITAEPTIRIGLSVIGADKHPGNLVGVSYDSGASVKQNGTPVATLTAGQQYSFAPTVNETWRIEPATSSGIATVSTYTDLAYNGSNDNRFRGVIEIKSASDGKVWLINELPMENYLRGIAETLNGDPPEYSKAFVIAARSYAFHHLQKGGKRTVEPFTIRRTSEDQLYKGYNFELRAMDPVAATVATRGMVAMFNNKPILAAYSSGAPGPTKSACEALSSTFCSNPDFTYLSGGVNDPPDTIYKTGATCGVGGNHCAGLDAAGARQMARLGSTAAQILTTYYPRTAIAAQW